MMKQVLLIAALMVSCTVLCANYAVLVAGSNGYSNYRHQSDVYHSYQILIGNGVPASNIIVMAYNDIANNKRNPFPGAVYNKPTKFLPGSNVYAGVQIDYSGADVTPQNFLAILTANKSGVVGGNGRVLESGPEDEVFIYFSDHGSPGLIAFPYQYLYANQLQAAFNTMWANKQYKQLTFYLETCESGSMFQGHLPDNISIYALSAANPTESSWATYCPPDDQVNGKNIGSCLGDEFSVNWMQNTEASDPKSWTLQQQFEAVKTSTVLSQVMQWGDLSFTSQPIGTFQGMGTNKQNMFLSKMSKYFDSAVNAEASYNRVSTNARDTHINYLLNQFNINSNDVEIYEELIHEITTTKRFNKIFEKFVSKYKLSGIYYGSTNFDCYSQTINRVSSQCGKINDQSTRHFKYLYQFCAMYSNWQNAEFEC